MAGDSEASDHAPTPPERVAVPAASYGRDRVRRGSTRHGDARWLSAHPHTSLPRSTRMEARGPCPRSKASSSTTTATRRTRSRVSSARSILQPTRRPSSRPRRSGTLARSGTPESMARRRRTRRPRVPGGSRLRTGAGRRSLPRSARAALSACAVRARDRDLRLSIPYRARPCSATVRPPPPHGDSRSVDVRLRLGGHRSSRPCDGLGRSGPPSRTDGSM